MARGIAARHRMADRPSYGRTKRANEFSDHNTGRSNKLRFSNPFDVLSDDSDTSAASQESESASTINEEDQISVNLSMHDEIPSNAVNIVIDNIPDDSTTDAGENIFTALRRRLDASPTGTLTWISPAYLRECAAENLTAFESALPFFSYSQYSRTIQNFFHLTLQRTEGMKQFRRYLYKVYDNYGIDVSAANAQTTRRWWPKDHSQWELPAFYEMQEEGGSMAFWVKEGKLMRMLMGRRLGEQECVAYMPTYPSN